MKKLNAMFVVLTATAMIIGCAKPQEADIRPEDIKFTNIPAMIKKGAKWKYQYRSTGIPMQQSIVCVSSQAEGRGKTSFIHHLTMTTIPVDMKMYWEIDASGLRYIKSDANKMITSYNPPLQILKFPVKVGDSWEQQVDVTSYKSGIAKVTRKVVSVENVTVKAGTFRCFKIHVKYEGPPESDTYDDWWSEKVGFVKSTNKNNELTEFSE